MEQRVDELSFSIDLGHAFHYSSFLIDLDIDDRQNMMLFHVSFLLECFGVLKTTSARHVRREPLPVFFRDALRQTRCTDKRPQKKPRMGPNANPGGFAFRETYLPDLAGLG